MAKHSILFVCHGNICRSPMAEMVMKHMVSQKGVGDEFYIESAATSTEEIGNNIYPPAQRMLRSKGVPVDMNKTARQVKKSDYEKFDMIYLMDRYNERNIMRILGSDPDNKVKMLLYRDVADPWYTGDFLTTYEDIVDGCTDILEKLGY